MLLFGAVRRSRRALFTASLMIVLGVVLNRVNAFIVAFRPPFVEKPYFPAVGELLVTAGAVAAIFFLYRAFVSYFPVLPGPAQEA
jgi:Ni/Fe-hydrogenase subunit HybB-like protein